MLIKTKPVLSYWICATPRTGGSLLCDLLRATGVAGRPEEYFWRDNEPFYREGWRVSAYADYVEQALHQGMTPNGVFGVKIDAGVYLSHFESQVRTMPEFGDLRQPFYMIITTLFPSLKFVWLTRCNKARQAVSWWKAVQTNEWIRRTGDPPRTADHLEYNFNAIDQLANESLMREAAWQAYFAEWRVKPLTIVYEDLVDDRAGAVASVLNFLGVNEPYLLRAEEIMLVKQADALSEEWVQRYREEKQKHWTNKAW